MWCPTHLLLQYTLGNAAPQTRPPHRVPAWPVPPALGADLGGAWHKCHVRGDNASAGPFGSWVDQQLKAANGAGVQCSCVRRWAEAVADLHSSRLAEVTSIVILAKESLSHVACVVTNDRSSSSGSDSQSCLASVWCARLISSHALHAR